VGVCLVHAHRAFLEAQNPMTVPEVKAAAVTLAAAITALVQSFEVETGCILHSLPVRPATAEVKTIVDVKVQIAG